VAEPQGNKPEAAEGLPPELSLAGIRKRPVSPLDERVWRFLLYISGGCLAAWLVPTLSGSKGLFLLWISAVLLTVSWGAAVRMLLVDSRAKTFWLVWLIVGALPLFNPSPSNLAWASVIFSFFFLLLRRYRPYRHLASRRQGWLFLVGIIVFCLLTIAWPSFGVSGKADIPLVKEATPGPQNTNILLAKGQVLVGYSLGSLRFFWFFSLFNLFFSIRLHFMRLKPKLAVSAFLIAVFPVLLVIIMGLMTLYVVLGESRALRARAILEDWAALAVRDESFIPAISERCFSYDEIGGTGEKVMIGGEKPVWLGEFISSLGSKNYSLPDLTTGAAAYFWIKGEVWLIDLSQASAPKKRLQGCLVGGPMLERLAKILGCNVELYQSNPINLFPQSGQRPKSITLDEKDLESALRGSLSRYEKNRASPQAPSESIWRRPLYFGMSNLDVIMFDSGNFEKRSILLATKSSLTDILGESLSFKNPLAQIVLGILVSMAVLLLILEAFALFFGVRITAGITQAVKSLHKGTRRIAQGDLDTPIKIPNEDEFGDLAFSFNQMSVAVKKGREEAVARGILERELRTAREIQQRLLPHEMPRVPGFEICGTSLPSQQVGGDYFDFIELETGELGIAIGDVSGKGMPAALLMANLQASLHAQVVKSGAVSDLLARMNNLLVQSTDKHMFATFFYGILRRMESTFIWSNAGHNPPLLFRASGEVERLEAGGLLLGFLPGQTYAQKEITLLPGDILVLYTDGITEASAPGAEKGEREFFGEQRLMDIVRANQSRTALEIQSAILRAISGYTADTPQEDDITLVIVKRVLA
jgi:HAMP domain-containing protein